MWFKSCTGNSNAFDQNKEIESLNWISNFIRVVISFCWLYLPHVLLHDLLLEVTLDGMFLFITEKTLDAFE